MRPSAELAELTTSVRAQWGVVLMTREWTTKIEPHIARELYAQIVVTLQGMPRLDDEHAEWMRRGRTWNVTIPMTTPPLAFSMKTWEAERLVVELEHVLREADRRNGPTGDLWSEIKGGLSS